jgi:hypothetical protein
MWPSNGLRTYFCDSVSFERFVDDTFRLVVMKPTQELDRGNASWLRVH